MRPETSKCSRGTSNKFNKTLTGGFNMHDPNNLLSNGQNTSIEGNPSLRVQMNMTGFNFRQSKQPLEATTTTTTTTTDSTAQQPSSSTVPQGQVFSTTSQGFYKHRKQNSFASGMTLDQYFQAPSPEEKAIPTESKLIIKNPFPPTSSMNPNISMISTSSSSSNSTDASTKAQSTTCSATAAASNTNKPHLDFTSSLVIDKKQSQASHFQHQPAQQPSNQLHHHDQAAEEDYNQEEFEIHEESCEEQDEDDDDDVSKNKKNNNKDSKRKSPAAASASQISNNESLNQHNDSNHRNSLNKKATGTTHNQTNKNCIEMIGNIPISIQPAGQGIQKVDSNAPRSTNMSNNATSSTSNTNVSTGLENIAEEAIQRKIREKYYKKTVYKHYQNPQSSIASAATGVPQSTAAAAIPSAAATQTSKKPSYGQQQQAHSFPHNNTNNTHGTQSILMNSNAANQIPNLQQSHTQQQQQSSSVFGRSTNTNFYSENQNAYDSINGFSPVKVPHSKQAVPTGTTAAATASTTTVSTQSRKTNRSQSPMYSIKRITNMVSTQHGQQRQSSKEPNDSFIEDCRRTFQMKDRSGIVNIGQKVNQQQQQQPQQLMDSHIGFRTSFYSKPQQAGQQAYGSQLQQQSQHPSNNPNTNLRLTVNEFYKNPHVAAAALAESTGVQQRGSFQTGYYHHHQSNREEDHLTDALMRRTAKENKFLNQKDKISEMAREDANYLTKHAARFNIHPAELASMKHKNN